MIKLLNIFKFIIYINILILFLLYVLYLSAINYFLLFTIYILSILVFSLAFFHFKKFYLRIFFLSLCSFFFSILIFDTITFLLRDKAELYTRERIGISDVDLRLYDRSFPSGYLFVNGEHNISENIYKNGKKINVYENIIYNIEDNIRVSVIGKGHRTCPNIILLGGSHNFGQGLNFDQTLQGILEKNKFSTLNLSIPGFGLSNSLSLLKTGKFREFLNVNCQKNEIKMIIYRAIPHHIIRDAGKFSLNIFGPDYRNFTAKSEVKAYCSNTASCLTYVSTYFISRLNDYFARTKNEKSAKVLRRIISQLILYTENDYKITKGVLADLNYTAELLGVDNRIVIVEGGDSSYKQEYLKLLVGSNFGYIFEEDYKYISACDALTVTTDYIANEGHPTECLNKKISRLILELLAGME